MEAPTPLASTKVTKPLTFRLRSLEDDDPWIVEQRLFDILNDFLQPDSTMPAVKAAQELDALLPMKRQVLEGETVEETVSFLLEFWGTIIALVKQIPHNHPSQEKMMNLIKALTCLPPTDVVLSGDLRTSRIWSDLPKLWFSMDDAWYQPSPKEDKYDEFEQWVNYNAFASRVLDSHLQKWYSFAVWALRNALEQEKFRSRDHREYGIRAAAQWIEHSRGAIFDALDSSDIDKEEVIQMVNGTLYHGKSGLSHERWIFWQERFQMLSESDLPSEVKETALRAAEQMRNVEQPDDASTEG